MCGRVACSLSPDGICTSLLNNLQNKILLKLKDASDFSKFQPSFNIAPSQYCCALTNCGTEDNKSVYNIECMQWGLVPSWSSSSSCRINNARSDSLLTKMTFIDILKKGQRCVLLVEGYYEWKTNSDKSKIPYYFYLPQCSEINLEKGHEEKHKILTIAALYDEVKIDNISKEVMKMFSVITVDADSSVAFVHDRMPAILNGYEEINAWLNNSIMPYTKAVKELIRPVNCLKTHRVSSLVNQSRNQGHELIFPYTKTEKKQVKSNSLMSWLKSSPKHTPTNKKEKFNDPCVMKDNHQFNDDIYSNTMDYDKEELFDKAIQDCKKDNLVINDGVFDNTINKDISIPCNVKSLNGNISYSCDNKNLDRNISKPINNDCPGLLDSGNMMFIHDSKISSTDVKNGIFKDNLICNDDIDITEFIASRIDDNILNDSAHDLVDEKVFKKTCLKEDQLSKRRKLN